MRIFWCLKDFIEEDQSPDKVEASNRTLIGEDEKISLTGAHSNDSNGTLDLTSKHESEIVNQRQITLEARPDTGKHTATINNASFYSTVWI